MQRIYNAAYYVWRGVAWLYKHTRLPVLLRAERWIYFNCRSGKPRA